MLRSCNDELDEILLKRASRIVFYGEAGAGKTNLILSILKCSIQSIDPSLSFIYISTEGSTVLNRFTRLGLDKQNIFFAMALDQLHIIEILLKTLHDLRYIRPIVIAIDSINHHYRIEALNNGARKFLEILILLDYLNEHGVYIISSAQVHMENGEEVISGIDIINLWADFIVEIRKDSKGTRTLRFVKPNIAESFRFVITDSGIAWI